MKIKKSIMVAGAIAVCAATLTGCSRLQGPEAKMEQSKRDKAYSESMLYIDTYEMDVALDADANKLSTTVTAELYNNTGETLEEIVFRLPADSCLKSKGGGLSWEVVAAYLGSDTGSGLEYAIDSGDSSVIRVALGDKKLEDKKSTFVTLEVKEDIPEEDMRFGHFKAGNHDQYVLSGCFPKVAEFRDGDWVINEIDWTGEKVSADTDFSQATDYHVKLTAPKGYNAVGTGIELRSEENTTLTAVDSRDFAVVVSNGLVNSYWTNDELTLKYYYIDGSKSNETAQEAVSWRVPTGMDWMEDYILKYPWNQYDIVTIYGDYEAHTYPGIMIFGDRAVYDGIKGDEIDAVRDELKLHFTETLFYQWFGEIAGCNEQKDGWLSKGLSTWLNDYLMANAYGDLKERAIGEKIRDMKKQNPEAMGLKLTDAFPDGKTADIVNTYRGAEFIEEIYNALGDEAFLAAIKDYVSNYQFKEADAQGFIETMKGHAGKDIDSIVEKYF